MPRRYKLNKTTYVSESSIKGEGEEVDWGEVQDREDGGQLAHQTESEHEGLPNEEEVPEDEDEVDEELCRAQNRNQVILPVLVELLCIYVAPTRHGLAQVDKDDVA